MASIISFFMIKELSIWTVIGGIAAALWVVPLIDVLYKLQFTVKHDAMKNHGNEEWMKIHGKDTGTPKLGGILIWLTIPAVLLLAFWNVAFVKALALIVFVVGFWGFLDDLMVILSKKNLAFRAFQETFEWRIGKLFISTLVNLSVAYFIIKVAGVTFFTFLGYVIPINNIFGVLGIAFTATIFSYSTEIIDGIDGLSSGMYLITMIGFSLLALAFPASFLTSASTTALVAFGTIIGVLIVYLYFNIPPARFYMGAPGAMPMGPVFLAIGLYGNMIPALIVLMLPYLFDLATSTMQIISLKFFNKRIFRIAPIHHHFEAIGWSGPKVVMRFWLFNWAIIFLAILAQVYLR